MWRPEGWKKCPIPEPNKDLDFDIGVWNAQVMSGVYEAGADAILKALKEDGLPGTYGEDFIISSRVKKDDPDWAEKFFKTLESKGTLVFIPEETQ